LLKPPRYKIEFIVGLGISLYLFRSVIAIMAYSFKNAVFKSAVGDFNVEIKYYQGFGAYSSTLATNFGSINCETDKLEYDPEALKLSICNAMSTEQLRGRCVKGDGLVKLSVRDGVHPDYTILVKITDGPNIDISVTKLLQDNIAKLVKQVIVNGTVSDFPVNGMKLHWHLTSYLDASHLIDRGAIEARVVDGCIDFISRIANPSYLVYVNPTNNYTIVAYLDKTNYLSQYIESGKNDKMTAVYDAIMCELANLRGDIPHGFVHKPKASFDPYNAIAKAASEPVAPVATTSKSLKLSYEGDFVVVESSAKISQVEFCFNVGISRLTVINGFRLVPGDQVKLNIENARTTTVMVDVNANEARLMFMDHGRSLVDQLSHVKFNVK
jgi:hypothetical protein